jgi:hypothetical protein
VLPNWNKIQKKVYEFTKTTISDFAMQHPDELISFFAYYINEQNGIYFISFDTHENTLRQIKEQSVTN